jgi:hypothetical protein
MKISIYGPHPDGAAIAELLKHIPEDAAETIIQAPPRRAIDLRPCMRPGHLEYCASIDNKRFVHLSQVSETAPYTVKIT